MNCPFCNKEMKKGVIQSPHEINWKPKRAKLFGAAEYHEGAVILSELNIFKGLSVVSYLQ